MLKKSYATWILVLSLICFFPFLGGVHLFDWDEINFAEIAREMILSNDYLRPTINFEPFWEKPPLFIWFQAISFHIFGMNDYAARFPNAVAGIATLLFLYFAGKKLHNKEFGLWWSLAYFGSILPHLYFRSGIIDPWFNFFIFLGIYYFYRYKSEGKKSLMVLLSGLFIGLAVLTKGPVALGLFGIVFAVVYLFTKFKNFISFKHLIIWLLTFVGINAIWYGVETILHGPWFVTQFVLYQIRLFMIPDAGHGGFFGYHFVVLLFGCFPASAFALPALLNRNTSLYENGGRESFLFLQKVLLLTVLIVFSIVTTKIVHYSSLAYFPLTYLAAAEIQRLIKNKIPLHLITKILLPFTAVIFSIALLALPVLFPYKNEFLHLIGDVQARMALEQIQLSFSWWNYIPGLLIIATIGVAHYIYKVAPIQSLRLLFLGSGFTVALALYAFIGKIESFSQGTAIEIFEEHAGETINVFGYKSYAHLYYGKVTHTMPKADDPNFKGEMIVVAKANSRNEINERFPEWILLKEKAGWLVYKKPAQ